MSGDRGGDCGDGLGLGVKLQSIESHLPHHQMVHHENDDDNQCRPFPWAGPTRGVISSGCEDIYSVVAVPGFGVRTLQQPFDISSAHHQHHHLSAFKSPGAGAMAATLGFPFTDAQWKELQRQAMIYKYMMASVPVPPDLLLPIARSFSASSLPATAPPLGGGFKLRFSGGTDPEPGRCRRTDGKKWRCSRDAAPDQKYCERHLHRGRPRSRKPVEHQVSAAAKKTKTSHHHHHSLTLPIPTPPLTSDISTPTLSINGFRTQAYHEHNQDQNIMVFDKSGEKATTLDPPPRGLEGMMMMKGSGPSEVLPQWHHQNLNNSQYTYLNCHEEDDDQSFRFSLAPRGFIDAWSDKNTTISADPKLTLGGSNGIEEEMGQIQMGLGLTETSQSTRTHQWMSPGGPLAEVLRPSSIAAAATATAEEASNLSSPVGTAASSPSGVLQKGLVSLSDSSGSSSPTTFAMPLQMQWLNQRAS